LGTTKTQPETSAQFGIFQSKGLSIFVTGLMFGIMHFAGLIVAAIGAVVGFVVGLLGGSSMISNAISLGAYSSVIGMVIGLLIACLMKKESKSADYFIGFAAIFAGIATVLGFSYGIVEFVLFQ